MIFGIVDLLDVSKKDCCRLEFQLSNFSREEEVEILRHSPLMGKSVDFSLCSNVSLYLCVESRGDYLN